MSAKDILVESAVLVESADSPGVKMKQPSDATLSQGVSEIPSGVTGVFRLQCILGIYIDIYAEFFAEFSKLSKSIYMPNMPTTGFPNF